MNAVVAQACSLRLPGTSTAVKGLKAGQASAKNRSKACPLGAKDAKGCNVCMIPQKENSAAGSDLSKFSKQSRVLTDHPFYVQIL